MRMTKMKKSFIISVFMLFLACSVMPAAKVNAATTEKELNIYGMYLNNDDKGDSVLLESKGNYLIMDLGVTSHAPAIIDQLNALGVRKVSIYFSHLHMDHTGSQAGDVLAGIREIAEAGFEIPTLYLPDPSLAPLSVDYPTKYERFESFMADYGEIEYLSVGSKFSFGDCTVSVIGPLNVNKLDPDKYEEKEGDETEEGQDPKYTFYENNCSLISIITCGNTRFFSGGDCLEDQAKFLVERYGDKLKCDIMKLSHHGTGSGNTQELLNVVKPRYSFCSNTGLTTCFPSTKQWQTKMAVKYASDHGMVYQIGSQKKTIIYQIKDNVIKMYTGKKIVEGKHLTGWKQLIGADGKLRKTDIYYLNQNGVPLTGVQKIDGKYFYLGEGGCMEYGNYSEQGVYQGWKSYGKFRRYFVFSADGVYAYMTTGFKKIAGATYYFNSNGLKLEGKSSTILKKIGSNYYAIGVSGALTINNWSTIGQDKYYFDAEGKMLSNKVVKIGKDFYVFDADGKMLRAKKDKRIVTLKSKKYAVGISGAIVRNSFATIGKDKYYLGSRGELAINQLIKIGKTYYAFGPDGKMFRSAKNKAIIKVKKKQYAVGTSGAIVRNSFATVGKDKYYFGSRGDMAVNKTVKIKKDTYYFGNDGKMVRSTRLKIGKKYYYFGISGAMYRNRNVTIGKKKYYCGSNGAMKTA